MSFFVLLLTVLIVTPSLGSLCTDYCDSIGLASTLYSGNATFCGSDGGSYNAPRGAINAFNKPGCYQEQCGIAVVYPGTCGCPNDCNIGIYRGQCNTAANTCACFPGWGGKDCSLVVCPVNTCSGHGTCISQPASKGGDFCKCSEGYTSADCSTAIPAGLNQKLPYGQLFPGSYYKNDKYGDDHPVFNTSLVHTIRLKINPANYNNIIDPSKLFNQTDYPAEFFFHNSYTNDTVSGTKVRLHGSFSRVFPKKSFNIKFGSSYKKLKGVTLKVTNFDRILSFQMMWDFHRSMLAQTYRMSMAELFVNEVYFGMYTMIEKINDNYEVSRYNVSQDTDMFKMALYDGQYLGNTSAPYQNLLTPIYSVPQPSISKEEGSDDSFTRLVEFATGLNASTSAARTAYLDAHFDSTAFLRSLSLEAISMQFDGYSGTGNNWIITDGSDNNKPYWEWTLFDFDSPFDGLNLFQDVIAQGVFHTTAAQLNQLIEAGLISLPNSLGDYFLSKNPYKFIKRAAHPKPVTLAVFEQANANRTFTRNMRTFLSATYANGNIAKVLARFDEYYALAVGSIYKDVFYTLDGSSVNLFYYTYTLTRQLFNDRLSYLWGLLACANTVTFSQTRTGGWNDGTRDYTQWSVTLRVGAEPLYAAQISVMPSAGNTIQNIYNVDSVGNGVYAVPTYAYQNGVLPAGSTYTFGYITTGTQQANFTLANEACSPPAGCNVTLNPIFRNSWSSDGLNQQYDIQVKNQGNRPLAYVDVRITLAAGSSLSQSYGLQSVSPNVYRCQTYNLGAGSSNTPGCGYTVRTPSGSAGSTYATIAADEAVCV